MKRGYLTLGAVLLLGLLLLPGSARAARADQFQPLSLSPDTAGVVNGQGELWMWGHNIWGQMGYPCQFRYTSPDPIHPEEERRSIGVQASEPVLALDQVVSVACSQTMTAAIRVDGTLWTWGSDSYGQLGSGGRYNRSTSADPDRGPYLSSNINYQDVPAQIMSDVAAVTCTNDTAAVIKTDGTLWVWGRNDDHQLGLEKTNTQRRIFDRNIDCQTVPVQLMEDVQAVSLASWGGGAVKTDGTLWLWGSGYSGLLGRDEGMQPDKAQVPFQLMDGVADIVCGPTCCAAIKTDGSLWMWGENTFSQMGDLTLGETYTSGVQRLRVQSTPVQVLSDVAQVSLLSDSVCAVKTDGSLWCWGKNHLGQTGAKSGSQRIIEYGVSYPLVTVPTQVADQVTVTAASQDSVLAGTQSSELLAWGANNAGQLGLSRDNCDQRYLEDFEHGMYTPYQSVPVRVPGLSVSNVLARPTPQPSEPMSPQSVGVDPAPSGTAYPALQPVELAGQSVQLAAYALRDGQGGSTNYVRVRDLAQLLNGTQAQFNVDFDQTVRLKPHAPYTTQNGQEGQSPFAGEQPYVQYGEHTQVDGSPWALRAFVLTDGAGGGHTYYKLRDLAQALDFQVDWTPERGVVIDPTPAASAND